MRTIPKLSFGDNLPSGGGKFVSLDNQGEAITFRLAAEPYFEYLHWMETEDGYERTKCVRLNNPDEGLECSLCEAGDRPNAKFYYPILNRDTGKAAIFRTSASVHIAIDNEYRDGVDVFKHDYKVTRVGGKNPQKYYRITRLAENIPLTAKDKKELKRAKDFDVANETGANRESSVSPDSSDDEVEKLFDEKSS